MNKNLLSKILAIGIIVLFIGIGIHPVFAIEIIHNDDSYLDEELVEVSVKFVGINGMKKHNVMLTGEQLDELDILFDNIRIDLRNSRTDEDIIAIYNNAVVSFDEIGILPDGISIKEAQRLVRGYNLISGINKLLRYFIKPQVEEDRENRYCYITGETTYTGHFSWFPFISKIFSLFGVYTELFFGVDRIDWPTAFAKGWIYTFGLYGIKEWNGSFWGKITEVAPAVPHEVYGIGVRLFFGTLIETRESQVSSYLGVASNVHLLEIEYE